MRGRRKSGSETNPRRVFSYAVNMPKDTPDVVFDAGREMMRLWNICVAEHEAICAEAKDKTVEEKRELFGTLYARCYPKLAKSWLPSTFYKFVFFRQFSPAQEAFAQGLRGAPKAHHRLDKIILPHVDASGGKAIGYPQAIGNKKPYHLRASLSAAGKRLSRAFITINDERVWFDAVIHRPMPEDAIIKQFALVGKLIRPFGWKWELQIIGEMPAKPVSAIDESKWVAIDFGWRRRENGLRLALLLDHDGQTRELLLPYRCDNASIRRREKMVIRHGLQPDIADWRDLWERQSMADKYLEEVKTKLRECDKSDWPEEARASMAGIVKMRGGGLNRLARTLGDAAPDFLAQWLNDSALENRRQRAAELRMIGQREWLYRNWASELAQKYDCLRYEGDISFKAIAEAANQDPAIKASQKYRADMASPHTLKLYLLEAFAKHGKRLQPLAAAYTTGVCSACGANVERRPDLYLTCDNGHEQDQDFNAVKNLADPNWPAVRAKRRGRAAKKEDAATE